MVPEEQLTKTPRVVKALSDYVWDEVHRLGHSYAGTEHLMLALTHDPEATAGLILSRLGVSLDEIRREVDSILGHGL